MTTLRLQELEALPRGSDEKLEFALALVERDRDLETVLAALHVLSDHRPLAFEAKPRLLRRYTHDGENGPRRDAGCHVRSGILAVLRGTFAGHDVALLEDAVLTREEIREVEVAGRLRAHALVALDDVDDELASYHAVRLLLDAKQTDPSNESAMTAVGVLAGRARLRPLYLFALTGGGHPLVVSECLRRLTPLPESLVPSLVGRHRGGSSAAVSVGLIDLLVGHEAWHRFRGDIGDVLASLADRDAYDYAVTCIVAGGKKELVYDLVTLARTETDQAKLRSIVDALSLRPFDDDVTVAVEELRERLR